MAADRRKVASVLLGLISSPLACMQLNVVLLNTEISYARRRLDISKLFTLFTGQNGRQKQLKRVGKHCCPQIFWDWTNQCVVGQFCLSSVNPNTCGRANSICSSVIKKYPDTCGRGLSLVTLCYVSQSENGTTRRPWFIASVQNKLAAGSTILRPVSTFSYKFRLFIFDGATFAEACFAEPLK